VAHAQPLDQRDGELVVRTYREGVAARAGHDLVLVVTRWRATLDGAAGTIALTADPRSLEVRDAVGGVKPLTARDRDEIGRTIEAKVLGPQPIEFRAGGLSIPRTGPFEVAGELSLAGVTRPVRVALERGTGGRVTGTVALVQSEWGIKPYRGLMGALKVRDEVELAIDLRLPGERRVG
jgi:hypothetical protein